MLALEFIHIIPDISVQVLVSSLVFTSSSRRPKLEERLHLPDPSQTSRSVPTAPLQVLDRWPGRFPFRASP